MTAHQRKYSSWNRFITLLAFFLILTSVPGCAQSRDQSQVQETPAAEAPHPETPPEPAKTVFAAIPDRIRPGEPLTVVVSPGSDFPDSPELRAVLMNGEGSRLSRAVFFDYPLDSGTVKAALLTVPSTARSGPAHIQLEDNDGSLGIIPLAILEREFVHEEIPLDQRNTDIRTVPDPQKTRESEILWSIISSTGTDIHAEGLFSPPVTSTRRTSHFGDRRVYRYTDGSTATSIHAGVDYGIPRGTPVLACAPGRVVLSAFRIVTGNSVIIEHLPGVYSLYYHLDKLGVNEGDFVETGVLLGESGSTGLSTGPHLHWEIRIAGENTDPDVLVGRPLLDKEMVIRTIGS
ncbi:M23 family metallopeptidase [Breznakiella homolactica]|uniref:M23 family metallopeptidase n=1 Tax=Breznakiella homolactica TaxID=2798577 RepID=A0A7T7XMH5_9SPIR|nr:M23 family metallopeptidase [Breznakiella homolactica]QQO09055.1 M23 family metallopeptidase [Breznakiella homolactica]